MRTITKFILTTGLIAGGVLAYSRVYKVKWSKFHQVTFKTTQPTRRTIIRKKFFPVPLYLIKKLI